MAGEDLQSAAPYTVEERMEGRGLALWLAALAFGLFFYASGLAALSAEGRAFSYLDELAPTVGFAFVAAALLVALILGASALLVFLRPSYALLSAAERTGVVWLEAALAMLVLAAAVVLEATGGWFFAPLVFALGVPVAASFFRPVRSRPLVTLPEAVIPAAAHFWSEPELPDVAQDEALPGGYRLHRFSWLFGVGVSDERRYTVDVPVSEALVDEMRALHLSRPPISALADLARRLPHDVTREIHALALGIRRIGVEQGFGILDETACVVACLSQSASRCEPGALSSYATPLLTMVDGGDNARAVPLLAAELLSVLGHVVVLIETSEGLCLGLDSASHLPGPFLEHEGGSLVYVGWTLAGGWRVGGLPGGLLDSIQAMTPVPQS